MVESTIANFRVALPKFERSVVNGKEIVFFQLQICSGRKKWKINKRYSDFSELDATMRPKFSNMPVLPPKTWTPLKYDKDIEDRRAKLSDYVVAIMNRPDMRCFSTFRNFIELERYCQASIAFAPVKLSEISDLQQGGRDFKICWSKGLMFVAMSDMKIASRLDSYITNVRFLLQ
jgi:hypothetical protein